MHMVWIHIDAFIALKPEFQPVIQILYTIDVID